MATTVAAFPATLEIDYPDRELDRLTSFFRVFTVIPVAILLALVAGAATVEIHGTRNEFYAGGALFLPTVVMLLVRRKYPRWWFDFNLELTRFSTRVWAYLALLRDEYPATDAAQAVHLELRYPDAGRELSRWLPLVKWLLALPHVILLGVLSVAACGAVLIAWFAILFTGRYPRGLFTFVVGVLRWWLRVSAYAILLTTDRYPPFTTAA